MCLKYFVLVYSNINHLTKRFWQSAKIAKIKSEGCTDTQKSIFGNAGRII